MTSSWLCTCPYPHNFEVKNEWPFLFLSFRTLLFFFGHILQSGFCFIFLQFHLHFRNLKYSWRRGLAKTIRQKLVQCLSQMLTKRETHLQIWLWTSRHHFMSYLPQHSRPPLLIFQFIEKQANSKTVPTT